MLHHSLVLDARFKVVGVLVRGSTQKKE